MSLGRSWNQTVPETRKRLSRFGDSLQYVWAIQTSEAPIAGRNSYFAAVSAVASALILRASLLFRLEALFL
jgi:hypothetical protein